MGRQKLFANASVALAATILVLAAPASAAGPVSGLLDTVAKTATPAVSSTATAVPQVPPSPAAAQQAGDAAPAAVPVAQTVERPASPSGPAGGDRVGASAQHGQDSSGAATAAQHAPADRPESATRQGERSPIASVTPTHGASSTSSASITVSSTAPQAPAHSSAPIGRLLTYGATTTAKRATADARRSLVKRPAGTGEGGLLSAQLSRPGGGVPARAVHQLTLAPAVLGEVSRTIGNVGETAARLAGSTPVAIAPALASLQSLPLTLPSLPASLQPPSLPLPSLPSVPVVPALPALPISTLPLPLPLQEPIDLVPPIGLTSGGALERSPAASQQGVAPVSAAPISTAPESVLGWPGTTAMPSPLGQTAAPQLRASTSAIPAGRLAAGEIAPTAPSLPATTINTYASAPPAGTAAPLTVGQSRFPAPSPGGISAATGAVAGTSIPIFLTLAGLLLLAAPRVRRVLRLLGESWRLSPLALIPERPG